MNLAELLRHIDVRSEEVHLEGGRRPGLLKRRELRRLATGAALEHLNDCEDSGVEPTYESIQAAIDKRFYGKTFDEVGTAWLSLLLPILIRLALLWWERRHQERNNAATAMLTSDAPHTPPGQG